MFPSSYIVGFKVIKLALNFAVNNCMKIKILSKQCGSVGLQLFLRISSVIYL